MNRLFLTLKFVALFAFVSVSSQQIFAQAQSDSLMYNFQTCKDKVLSYSKDIMKSNEQKIAMEEAVKYVFTNKLPRIDLSGSFQYRINKYDLDFGGMALNMPRDNYNLGLSLSQIIYNGGSIKNNYQAAKIQDSIAANSVDLTIQNIAYAADVNYWNAVAQRALYLAMGQYEEIVNSLVEILHVRYNDGMIAKTDYLQALSRLKEAELTKSDAYKSYIISLQNLNVMMGLDPMTPIVLADSIAYKLPDLEYVQTEIALMRRPDYRISQLQVDYQKKQLRIIQSDFNPQLSIGLQETWGTQALNFNGSTMFNTVAYASLKVPIFAWGSRYKRSNSQKAMIQSAILDREQSYDNITKEIANSWTNYQENTKQIGIAKEATIISEESMELNTFSYQEGRLTILDVLTSQLTWIQSKTKYISTLLTEKTSRAQYLKAVGEIK